MILPLSGGRRVLGEMLEQFHPARTAEVLKVIGGLVRKPRPKMKVFKTLVSFSEGALASLLQVDTIEHEGNLWLVPEWVPSPDGKSRTPTRIIQLNRSECHKMTGHPDGDFVLTRSIPKAVFEGQQSGGPYIVVERPDIKG